MLNKRIFLLTALLLCFLSDWGFAQAKLTDRLVFEVQPRFGHLYPHHEHIGYFIQKHVAGFQVKVGLAADGHKDWHWRYHFPVVGIGFYRSTLGNNDVYGHLNGLFTYLDFMVFDFTKRFNIGNYVALGLAYNDKRFDLITNRQNYVVGTNINVFFQYDIVFQYLISPQMRLKLQYGVTHASNGNFREPNNGFNVLTMGLGLQYYLKQFNNFKVDKPTIFADSCKLSLSVGVLGGVKAVDIDHNSLYPSFGILAELNYRLIPSGLLGIELSAYRDQAMRQLWINDGHEPQHFRNRYFYRFALNPTYLIQMGRAYITISPGIYLNFKHLPWGLFTNKLGFRYQFGDNLFAALAVKTHYVGNCDFIEFSLRYKFNIID